MHSSSLRSTITSWSSSYEATTVEIRETWNEQQEEIQTCKTAAVPNFLNWTLWCDIEAASDVLTSLEILDRDRLQVQNTGRDETWRRSVDIAIYHGRLNLFVTGGTFCCKICPISRCISVLSHNCSAVVLTMRALLTTVCVVYLAYATPNSRRLVFSTEPREPVPSDRHHRVET